MGHEKEPAQEGSVLEPFSAGVNFTRNMHFVRRQSILDCAKHRKTFSRTRHSRQFQLDSTQPRGMGSAKTPKNVCSDFSLDGDRQFFCSVPKPASRANLRIVVSAYRA